MALNSESWIGLYDNNRELRIFQLTDDDRRGHSKELLQKEVDLMLESLCLVTECWLGQ